MKDGCIYGSVDCSFKGAHGTCNKRPAPLSQTERECCEFCKRGTKSEHNPQGGYCTGNCPCHHKSGCCNRCLGTATVMGTFSNHYCSKELDCPCHTPKSERPKRDVGVVKIISAKMPEWYEKSNWTERFDSSFPSLWIYWARKSFNISNYSSCSASVKLFIATERENVRGEVIAEIEAMRLSGYGHPERSFYGTAAARSYAAAYNKTLDDVLARLKNNK